MSSIASRTLARSTRTTLRQTRAPLCSSRLALQQSFWKQPLPQTSQQAIRAFSATMIPKSDAMAAPKAAQEFDKEIVDMAAYAHGYKVDSDLAVRYTTSLKAQYEC